MRAMKMNKKTTGILAAGLLVASAGGAYAYWTTTGGGTGSAANASTNGTVTLHASWTAGVLVPGGAQDVSFTADNAGSTSLYVGTIHLDSVSVDGPHSTCATSDFTMADVPSNTVAVAGALAQALGGTGSLVYADDAINNQNACKGATITLNLSSN